MMNQFGDEEEAYLQYRLRAQQAVKATKKSFIDIRMTNAQMHADNSVRNKIAVPE